jgi:signal peptidase II
MAEIFLFSVVFLLLDQGSKNLAEVRTAGRSIRVGPFLRIRCVAHSITKLNATCRRMLFPVLWLIALASAVFLYRSGGWFQTQSALFGLALALSGAAGNLIDLIWRKHILNFFDLGWWPVFNLADVGIVAGLVLAFWPRG